MKKINAFFMLLAVIMMTAMAAISCEKQEIDTFSPNIGYGDNLRKIPSDSLVDAKVYMTAALTNGQWVIGAKVNDVYLASDGSMKEIEKLTEAASFIALEGVDAQYIHGIKAKDFTTANVSSMTERQKDTTSGRFTLTHADRKDSWEGVSSQGDKASHMSTAILGTVKFSYAHPELNKVVAAELKLDGTISEKTSVTEEVGVPYEGKTYGAVKYSSEITLTGANNEGSATVENTVYFLKHAVNTEIKNLRYEGNFYAENNQVKKSVNKDELSLVTTDNGEVIDSKDCTLPMAFELTMTQPEDEWVYSMEDLKSTNYTTTDIRSQDNQPVSVDAFTKVETVGGNEVRVGGRVSYVTFNNERYMWGEKVLPYAFHKIEEKVTFVRDEAYCTNDVEAVLITIETIDHIGFDGVSRASEDRVAKVSYHRFYALPDSYTYEYTWLSNKSKYEEERKAEGHVISSLYRNVIKKVTYNRGTAVDSTEIVRDINNVDNHQVEVAYTGGMTVTSEQVPTEAPKIAKITVSSSSKGDNNDLDETGYRSRYTEEAQTVEYENGLKFTFFRRNAEDTKNGERALGWSEYQAIDSKSITTGTPKLVDSLSSSTELVYEVTSKATVKRSSNIGETKAGNSTELTARGYIRVADQYVPGKDETEWFVTENGNSITFGGRQYEYYTVSGKVLVDEQSYTVTPSFNGGTEPEQIVENVDNYRHEGNSQNVSGKGSYSSNLTNGSKSFAYNFSYDAPAGQTVQLKGRGGKGASKTFSALMKIEVVSLEKGSSSVVNGYTVYPMIGNAKATYSMENKSVVINASSSRNLLVKVPDVVTSTRIVKDVQVSGNVITCTGILYETWSNGVEKEKDRKSGKMTYTLTGKNGADVVVDNADGYAQKGNGLTSTGTGVYTNYLYKGSNSYDCNFDYSAPASLDLVLEGTNGNQTVSFNATHKIEDAGMTNGTQSTSNGYYVNPRTSNVKGSYSVEGKSVVINASSSRNLLVKREIPKIIPADETIIGGGMSAVVAHIDGAGNFVYQSNVSSTAASCLCIVTNKGARPVVFGWADQEPIVPTASQIQSAPFTAGSYTSDYNSGVYINGWIPAIARDYAGVITYSIPTQQNILSVRSETLNMWGWRGGNFSTVLSQYQVSVKDGVMTIYHNGTEVMSFR